MLEIDCPPEPGPAILRGLSHENPRSPTVPQDLGLSLSILIADESADRWTLTVVQAPVAGHPHLELHCRASPNGKPNQPKPKTRIAGLALVIELLNLALAHGAEHTEALNILVRQEGPWGSAWILRGPDWLVPGRHQDAYPMTTIVARMAQHLLTEAD